MTSYNGYTAAERNKKLRASYKLFPNHSHPYYQGPCHFCADPVGPVEPHSEDYSEPYLWEKPAEYAVCNTCHSRLHKRFANPSGWEAYKRHVKRGGYGADLKTPKIAREVRHAALARGESPELPPLRPFAVTDLWWDALTTDPASLTAVWARPR
jgi:hypothetical protein